MTYTTVHGNAGSLPTERGQGSNLKPQISQSYFPLKKKKKKTLRTKDLTWSWPLASSLTLFLFIPPLGSCVPATCYSCNTPGVFLHLDFRTCYNSFFLYAISLDSSMVHFLISLKPLLKYHLIKRGFFGSPSLK